MPVGGLVLHHTAAEEVKGANGRRFPIMALFLTQEKMDFQEIFRPSEEDSVTVKNVPSRQEYHHPRMRSQRALW